MDLRDLFFPKRCLFCNKSGRYLCERCVLNVPKARQKCPVCNWYSYQGRTHPACNSRFSLDGHYAQWQYTGVIRKGIHAFKYRFASDIVGEFAIHVLNNDFQFRNSLFLPVPMHISRENWRGFNQSDLLAKTLALKTGNIYAENVVYKTKNTTPQAQLGKKDRLQNLRGKFAVNKGKLEELTGYKTIFIVDDVWTTGSTIKEVAKVLIKAGAKNVWGFTLAS